jgi:hypothetical protein
MKINTIKKRLHLDIFKKINPTDKKESKLQIGNFDENSEVVTINKIGIPELGHGAVILKTGDGRNCKKYLRFSRGKTQ